MNKTSLGKFIIMTVISFVAVGLITSKINLAFNQSSSLSGRVFLIVKGTLPKERFERVIFKDKEDLISSGNAKYPVAHNSKVKQVIGFDGDVVSVKKTNGVNHIYINNQDFGIIKEYSLKGEKLYQVTEESRELIIPKDYYFVYAPHKDSYDSRYKSIGLIHKSQIIGRAYEIL